MICSVLNPSRIAFAPGYWQDACPRAWINLFLLALVRWKFGGPEFDLSFHGVHHQTLIILRPVRILTAVTEQEAIQKTRKVIRRQLKAIATEEG